MPPTMMIGSLSDCECSKGKRKGTSGTKPLRAGQYRGGIGEPVVLEGGTRGLSGVGRGKRRKPDIVCKVNRRGDMVCRPARRRKKRR